MADLSLLEQARARAAARRARKASITIDALDIELICDVPTDISVMERIRDGAKRKGKVRPELFARAFVAQFVDEIRIAGEPFTMDGEPVNFRDPELHKALGVATAGEAVVELLGADGDILNVAAALQSEAGFSDDVEFEADPI